MADLGVEGCVQPAGLIDPFSVRALKNTHDKFRGDLDHKEAVGGYFLVELARASYRDVVVGSTVECRLREVDTRAVTRAILFCDNNDDVFNARENVLLLAMRSRIPIHFELLRTFNDTAVVLDLNVGADPPLTTGEQLSVMMQKEFGSKAQRAPEGGDPRALAPTLDRSWANSYHEDISEVDAGNRLRGAVCAVNRTMQRDRHDCVAYSVKPVTKWVFTAWTWSGDDVAT